MTIAVVYHSAHHGNTKKVLDAVAGKFDVELVNADEGVRDLSGYDIVGLASGIYYSKFHESVMDFAKDPSIRGKDVFLLFTSGMSKESYADGIRSALEPMGVNIIGTFHCLGLDTFGPFKLVGGIAKGHPDQKDLDDAVRFFRENVAERTKR